MILLAISPTTNPKAISNKSPKNFTREVEKPEEENLMIIFIDLS